MYVCVFAMQTIYIVCNVAYSMLAENFVTLFFLKVDIQLILIVSVPCDVITVCSVTWLKFTGKSCIIKLLCYPSVCDNEMTFDICELVYLPRVGNH